MKLISCLLLAFLTTQSFAYGCLQFETQIIAKGDIFSIFEDESCSVKVTEVRDYKPSIICPILLEEIFDSFVTLTPSQCDLVESDSHISGIIVGDLEGNLILEN